MLTVDFRKNGSKHTVIVREGDVTLFMDDICLSKASERRRFIENVRQRTPEADPDRLEQELLQKADMVLKEPAEEMESVEPADDLPD
ncbi:MAG: hypothetical protein FJ279_24220, partial [Planctomycetes bacterium]|nr:hypothetical protein [Planctomycetota bacterium]